MSEPCQRDIRERIKSIRDQAESRETAAATHSKAPIWAEDNRESPPYDPGGGGLVPPPRNMTRSWGDPEERPEHDRLSWIHVPATGGLHAVVLSPEPYCYQSHWVDGRMRPCAGIDCTYCRVRVGTQDRFIVTLLVADLLKRGLMELGYKPIRQLRELTKANLTARGTAIYLYHEHNNPRGKILITPSDCANKVLAALPARDDGRQEWPAEIDAEAAMNQNWQRIREDQH